MVGNAVSLSDRCSSREIYVAREPQCSKIKEECKNVNPPNNHKIIYVCYDFFPKKILCIKIIFMNNGCLVTYFEKCYAL